MTFKQLGHGGSAAGRLCCFRASFHPRSRKTARLADFPPVPHEIAPAKVCWLWPDYVDGSVLVCSKTWKQF